MQDAINTYMPKYSMIKQDLIEKINRNEFPPDQCLPSEKQLMQTYEASRITVRRALSEMETEKYIYRQ